jgi:hypothetical protein
MAALAGIDRFFNILVDPGNVSPLAARFITKRVLHLEAG